MADPLSRLRRFFRELKRRNVYKVAVAYLAVAFVGLQTVDLLIPATTLPSWADAFLLALLIIGFPIALVVAWAFEMTPEGVRRTREAERPEEGASEGGRGLSAAYKVLVGLGLVGAAVAGSWYLTGGGGTTVSDRSVAVLPFEAQGQEEAGPFTAGMHAALSNRLGNVSDLRVSPSRAVQAFEDTALSTAEIAGELGVAWVVSGIVQTTEDEVQVIVELVDPTTGTQRWSDDYTRDLTTESLFDLQSEISREIAASLEAELTPEERERIERRPTEDLEAYRLYTKGRNLVDSRRSSAIDSAKTYFRRALREDSTYALAWAGLADARILHPGWMDSFGPEEEVKATREAIPAAREAARKALELDSDLAEAHAAMGTILLVEQRVSGARGHGPVALQMLERAVALRPSYAQAHYRLGRLLLGLGRPETALRHLNLAVELNPALITAHRGRVAALLASGEYEEALASVRRSQERLDFLPAGESLEAGALLHLERWEEARALAREHGAGTGDAAQWARTPFAVAELGLGDSAVARRRIEELMTSNERPDSGRHWEVAWLHAALGNDDEALSALERIDFDEPHFGAPMAGILRFYYPRYFSSLRDTARFQRLIRDVNRFWGLNPDGSLPDSVDVSFETEPDE